MKKYIIAQEAESLRLDKYLASIFPDRSRSGLQKMIEEGDVTVNGRAVSKHRFLKPDDIIEIKSQRPKVNLQSLPKNAEALPLFEIIQETEEYAIINKPAGVIVHGAPHITGPTLADQVVRQWPKLANVGEYRIRPGIVHRLDRDVSGLMVIAKTQPMFEALKKQFKNRDVNKEYAALVYGKTLSDAGRIDFPIDRSAAGYKMAARPQNQAGKKAVTTYKTLRRFINYTLLKVKIVTGRTHQIRAHLAAIDHPIVGDGLYGTKKAKDMNLKIGTNRIFLSAVRLSFKDLDGSKKEFKINLPEEFEKLMERIK